MKRGGGRKSIRVGGSYFLSSKTSLGFGPFGVIYAGTVELEVGPPAAFHARQPPASEVTRVYPMVCSASAAKAERKPPPQ
jgi:hypothetical protein